MTPCFKIPAARTALSVAMGTFALTAFTAQSVLAADMPAAPPPVYQPVPQPTSGWYIAGRLGVTIPDDTDFSVLGLTVDNEYDAGFTGSAAIGSTLDAFSEVLRLEAELGWTGASIDSHTVQTLGTFADPAAFGDTEVFYGLVNAYVDFPGWAGPITPYVTAGIGAASVDFDGHGVTPTGVVMDDNAAGLAWQIGAGATFDLGSRTKLEAGYRYFNVEGVDLAAVDGTTSDVDVRSHQLTLGIRYHF